MRLPSKSEAVTSAFSSYWAPQPGAFPSADAGTSWRIEPKPTYVGVPIFRTGVRRLSAPVTSCRNRLSRYTFAGLIDAAIESLAGPLAEWFGQLPSPAGEVLAGRYGLEDGASAFCIG